MIRQEEIAAEVEQVLESPHFSSSPSLARTLTFCVETTLRDDHASLKETIIGISCFGRDPGYDTKLDPIVRVTIRRMRKKLESYYLDEGRHAKIRIDFPKGSYVPQFECIERQILPEENDLVPSPAETLAITEQTDLAAVSEVTADEDTFDMPEDVSFGRSFWPPGIRSWEVSVLLVLLAAVTSIGFAHHHEQTQQESKPLSGANRSVPPSTISPPALEAMVSPRLQSVVPVPEAEPVSNNGQPPLAERRAGVPTSSSLNTFSTLQPVANEIEVVALANRTGISSPKAMRVTMTADANQDTATATWTEPRL